jgi:hypothetical protein
MAQPTACHAPVARRWGHQAAAAKRLARVRHTAPLAPRPLAAAGRLPAFVPLPAPGPLRLALDWTSAGPQPLLGGAWILGRGAVPLDWRADDAALRTGQRQREARAVRRRAVPRVLRPVGGRRGRGTAARGGADGAVVPRPARRGRGGPQVRQAAPQSGLAGGWHTLHTLRLAGKPRRRTLGHRRYGAR